MKHKLFPAWQQHVLDKHRIFYVSPGVPGDSYLVTIMECVGGYTVAPHDGHGEIDQALSVLNGEVTRRLSDSRNGSLVYAIMRDNKETPKRIEALYLSILSRRPTTNERQRAEKYLAELKGYVT